MAGKAAVQQSPRRTDIISRQRGRKRKQTREFKCNINDIKDKREEPVLKKQRVEEPKSPSALWDSLSQIWLTSRALREHDRRNDKLDNHCSCQKNQRKLRIPVVNSSSLALFARHGGPDLTDIRGFPEMTKPSMAGPGQSSGTKRSSDTPQSTSSKRKSGNKRSSAYDVNFEVELADNGIYLPGHEYAGDQGVPKPLNLADIRKRLASPRRSLSPSIFGDDDFDKFQLSSERARSEATVMKEMIPVIEGNCNIKHEENMLCNNFKSITNNTTVDPQPDLFDGSRTVDLHCRIRQEIGDLVVPTKKLTAPVAPNFFFEAKGPAGQASVLKRQACHDGACGARAMHALQTFGLDSNEYDNKAYLITSTYYQGHLYLYTTFPTRVSGHDKEEYHMTQLRSFSMTDTAERFREGAQAFRNAREWAKEQRDRLIKEANTRAVAMDNISNGTGSASSSARR